VTKPQSFMDFVRSVEEETGKKIIISSDEYNDLIPTKFISTGSISLDACLGLGGIPKGRLTTIYGPESSGKTTLIMMLVKNCILQYKEKSLIVDVEHTFDVSYAYQLIGEKDFKEYVVLIQPDTAEAALEILGRGIESKEFGLAALDSIGDLSPEKEKKERDFAKQDVALVPRLLGKFLRIYKKVINTNDVAVVLLNQVRDNIGSYYGGVSLSGGHALKHDSSIIIYISKADEIKAGEEIIGILTKFVVKKNKMAKPYKTSTFPIIFGEGISRLQDLVEFGKKLGVITPGAWNKYKGEILGQGVNKTMLYLQQHPEIELQIRTDILNLVNTTSMVEEDLTKEEDGV
jgi:recombination protein RecA